MNDATNRQAWTDQDTDEFLNEILKDSEVVDTLRRTIWDTIHPEVENVSEIIDATIKAEDMEAGDEQDKVFDEIDCRVNNICEQVCSKLYRKLGIEKNA